MKEQDSSRHEEKLKAVLKAKAVETQPEKSVKEILDRAHRAEQEDDD